MQVTKPKYSLNPAQFTMLSFLALSFLGAFLLMAPFSNTNGKFLDFSSAFFMSVSSVCVTGLAVIDLGKDLTLWGQIIILVLVQIGGLSYMTITTIFVYLIGKKISYRQAKAFNISNNSENKIHFADFVIRIGIFTFLIEALGFLFFFFDSMKRYSELHPNLGFLESFYSGAFQAFFHSVSAFCNAGLSLYSDSVSGFRDNFWVMFNFSFLTILGGLGYTVLNELSQYFTRSPTRRPLSLHTKVSLSLTAFLLVFGFLVQLALIYILELPNDPNLSLNNGIVDNSWVAFFQTCAARSSGFNTIDLRELGDPSLLLLIVWMFIGSCPGGTGGGIKVTTLMVVLAVLWAGLKNSKNTKLFNRSIPEIYQKKAIIVFVSTVLGIILSLWLLSVLEFGKGLRIIDLFFEVCSAFTTVGLSTGITSQLSDSSLMILALCMLIGRPGPLLFLMSLVDEHETKEALYPEEGVLIG